MPRGRLRRGGMTVATALLLVAMPATMASADPGDGIGDPYFPTYGNTGYNVDHYDLRLNYKPKTDKLKGTATLIARATEELDAFTLDFLLDVNNVRVNGKPAKVESSGDHKVEVRPKGTVAEDEQLIITVKYSGVPSEVEGPDEVIGGWNRSDDGAIALGEPEVAWWWFPSNDHPRDKATFDVRVTVPKGNKAISNGVLTDKIERGNKTIFKWRQDEPSTTYLATLAVGKFDVNTRETSDGLPVYNAYSDDLGSLEGPAKASIGRGEEILDFQSEIFGPYPYNALGGVVAGPDADLGFALETQTRPVYSHAFFDEGSNPYVVSHELAHQWFGDHVSVHNWKDIWLNEGFASYAEWMWSEEEGEGTAQELADYTYNSYPADSPFWDVKPGDPGKDNVFHAAVYDRGALAVHALRQEVGDDAFFDILKTWQEENAHGNATVQDFIALSEKISGQQLDTVFDRWLFSEGRPDFDTANESAISTKAADKPKSWEKINDNHDTMAQQAH